MSDIHENPLACPDCKTLLARSASVATCSDCGRTFPSESGVACFNRDKALHGEFTREEMSELLEFVREQGWKSAVENYIRPRRPDVVQLLRDERRSNFRSLLGLNGSERVLDIGCGFGGISLQLSKRVAQVVAIDNTYERVSFLDLVAAEEGYENLIPVCNGDILRLPLASNYFDAVCLIGVFEYLPVDMPDRTPEDVFSGTLGEIRRVLKPGGALYLGTKNRFGSPYIKGEADHNGLRFGPLLPRPLADLLCRTLRGKPYRIILHSLRGYRKLLHDAGFAPIEAYWPSPGYQYPDRFIDLGENARTLAEAAGGSPAKSALVSILGAIGVLPHVVPFFGFVARKSV